MKKISRLFALMAMLSLINSGARAQYQVFMHHGLARKYILHMPNFLPANSPLVFMLHAYGGTPIDIINYSGMNAIADLNSFAVCYPMGTKDEWNLNCWNVGYDFQLGMTVDDVDFLDSLAFYLQTQYNLNPARTFLSGHSNGGDMCYLVACRDAGNFKAVAPVSGCLMKWIHDTCNTSNPIPVFEIHGTNDSTTYWNGDPGNTQGYGPYYDVPFTFNFWVNASNCPTEMIDTLPDLDPTDGSIVISDEFSGGINGNQVWLYKILGGGHAWPGTPGPGNNQDINTSGEIWNFFNHFPVVNSVDERIRDAKTFRIFPNPASEFVTLRSDSGQGGLRYIVYDLFSRPIITGKMEVPETTVDVSKLPAGAYWIKCGDNHVQLMKL